MNLNMMKKYEAKFAKFETEAFSARHELHFKLI